MSAPEIKEFSLTYEVDKLKKILQLPVTNIVFDERYEYGKLYLDHDMNLTTIYGSLYVNNDLIGTIPYMSDKWGPMYDTGKQHELAWDKIYRQFQQVITGKILEQEPLTDTIEPGKYKSLLIRDKDGVVIKKAFCNYISNEWNVTLSGPDAEERKVEIKVVLSPPPPPVNL